VPVLDVFNKVDQLEASEREALRAANPDAVAISARDRVGREDLLAAIAGRLSLDATRVHLSLDSSLDADRRLLAELYRHARVMTQTETDAHVSIEAEIPRRLLPRFARATVPA
jgi:50S ribosomal subunit-associated GTPase HflX